MAEIETRVGEVRAETSAAATLRLEVEGPGVDYRPGQHVTIEPRQFPGLASLSNPGYYSLSSDGLDPRRLEITVKETPGTPLAHYLVRRIRPGDRIRITGPAGRYHLPDPPPGDVESFLHLCAGSGAAPSRGMIRHALGRGWPHRHLLVLQDRTEADILFRREWEDLRDREGSKFRLALLLSGKGEVVTPARLRGLIEGVLDPARSVALVCGPNRPRGADPGFVDRWAGPRDRPAEGLLAPLGFAPARILREG